MQLFRRDEEIEGGERGKGGEIISSAIRDIWGGGGRGEAASKPASSVDS